MTIFFNNQFYQNHTEVVSYSRNNFVFFVIFDKNQERKFFFSINLGILI